MTGSEATQSGRDSGGRIASCRHSTCDGPQNYTIREERTRHPETTSSGRDSRAPIASCRCNNHDGLRSYTIQEEGTRGSGTTQSGRRGRGAWRPPSSGRDSAAHRVGAAPVTGPRATQSGREEGSREERRNVGRRRGTRPTETQAQDSPHRDAGAGLAPPRRRRRTHPTRTSRTGAKTASPPVRHQPGWRPLAGCGPGQRRGSTQGVRPGRPSRCRQIRRPLRSARRSPSAPARCDRDSR